MLTGTGGYGHGAVAASGRRAAAGAPGWGNQRGAGTGGVRQGDVEQERANEASRHQNSPEHPPVDGTSEHQSLSKYIQARFDECSRSQKDVAQYIVDHLDEAAFQTAEELARRANTSSSTVVRFSQALGFEGFPELQAAAREEYRRVNAKAAKEPAQAPPTRSSRWTRTSSRRPSRPTT